MVRCDLDKYTKIYTLTTIVYIIYFDFTQSMNQRKTLFFITMAILKVLTLTAAKCLTRRTRTCEKWWLTPLWTFGSFTLSIYFITDKCDQKLNNSLTFFKHISHLVKNLVRCMQTIYFIIRFPWKSICKSNIFISSFVLEWMWYIKENPSFFC